MATFFDTLAERTYESDASQALQVPLFKNRERLFTFLQHDGVSWNNNLAENAIKRISNYRDDVGRSAKEAGFTEHSVLLSIYQTCHIRDISFSFLKFLLSRERDVDAFAAGKRHRQRGSSSIQRDTCHLRSFRFAGGKLRTLAV